MHDFPVESVVKHFHIRGEFANAERLGRGHINDTYLITTQKSGKTFRYILQRINHNIFKNLPALMENIVRITSHIHDKLKARGSIEQASRVITIIETDGGASFYESCDGNFWRMYNAIENARIYEVAESPDQAYEVARMFGWFQKMLIDLPDPPLNEIIPDFHNTPKRLQAFNRCLQADLCNRAAGVKDEIDFVREHEWMSDVLLNLAEKGQIPIRITHNDAKINNVMLDDRTGRGLCVIDLDTVMPGLSLYDFGDIVRTAATAAAEDQPDLSKVNIQMPLFEAVLRGYCSEAMEFLTPVEKQHLVFAGKLITFEQYLRFLGDYLAGDLYYKTHHAGHNLQRARTQMKLITSLIAHQDRMNAIVENL